MSDRCPNYAKGGINDGDRGADDLISRQAAIDAIQTINSEGDSLINSVLGIIELKIIDLPSAQPERRGRWIQHHGEDFGRCSCCACPEEVYGYVKVHWNFCPNCGADMRGEE